MSERVSVREVMYMCVCPCVCVCLTISVVVACSDDCIVIG